MTVLCNNCDKMRLCYDTFHFELGFSFTVLLLMTVMLLFRFTQYVLQCYIKTQSMKVLLRFTTCITTLKYSTITTETP